MLLPGKASTAPPDVVFPKAYVSLGSVTDVHSPYAVIALTGLEARYIAVAIETLISVGADAKLII
jgi:hypothetical protein